MVERKGQKLKLIAVLDILKRHSDEQKPLTAQDICNYLEKLNITAERKSIYSDLEALTDYGYDIVKATVPKRGFFLASREFEEPEIYLLADAVRTAKFISAKKTRELVRKLDSMLSENQAREREKGIYINGEIKCDNEEIYYSIDIINRAILQKKKIRFKYSIRELADDRTIRRKTKEMFISPYALTWQDDHYYLIGNYEKYDNLLHLRLDRMKSVIITEDSARPFSEVSEYTEKFDIADYTNKLFNMHGGKMEEIELCCNKKIIEQVADRFSENIFIKKVTENEFSFSVKAAVSDALVTWIINYGKNIKVTSPESLKLKIIERAQKVLELYK